MVSTKISRVMGSTPFKTSLNRTKLSERAEGVFASFQMWDGGFEIRDDATIILEQAEWNDPGIELIKDLIQLTPLPINEVNWKIISHDENTITIGIPDILEVEFSRTEVQKVKAKYTVLKALPNNKISYRLSSEAGVKYEQGKRGATLKDQYNLISMPDEKGIRLGKLLLVNPDKDVTMEINGRVLDLIIPIGVKYPFTFDPTTIDSTAYAYIPQAGSNHVVMDADGKIHYTYRDSDDSVMYGYTTAIDTTLHTTEDAGQTGQRMAITLDSNNKPHIVFENSNEVYAIDKTGASWSGTTTISTNGYGAQPDCDMGPNNVLQVVYHDTSTTQTSIKYWRTGITPETIHMGSNYPSIQPKIAVDSSNNAHISYGAGGSNGRNEDLKYTKRIYSTGSKTNITISTTSTADKFWNPCIVLDHDDKIWIAVSVKGTSVRNVEVYNKTSGGSSFSSVGNPDSNSSLARDHPSISVDREGTIWIFYWADLGTWDNIKYNTYKTSFGTATIVHSESKNHRNPHAIHKCGNGVVPVKGQACIYSNNTDSDVMWDDDTADYYRGDVIDCAWVISSPPITKTCAWVISSPPITKTCAWVINDPQIKVEKTSTWKITKQTKGEFGASWDRTLIHNPISGEQIEKMYGRTFTKDHHGRLHVVYNKNNKTSIYYKYSTDGGSSWSSEEEVESNSYQVVSPTIVVDKDRNVYVGFENDQNIDVYVYKRTFSSGNWTTFASKTTGDCYEPMLVIDKNDYIHLMWRAGISQSGVKHDWHNGTSWQGETTFETSGFSNEGTKNGWMCATSDGDVHGIYVRKCNASGDSVWKVCYRKWDETTQSWSVTTIVTSVRDNDHPQIIADSSDYLHACWRHDNNGLGNWYAIGYAKYVSSWTVDNDLFEFPSLTDLWRPTVTRDQQDVIYVMGVSDFGGDGQDRIYLKRYISSWSETRSILPGSINYDKLVCNTQRYPHDLNNIMKNGWYLGTENSTGGFLAYYEGNFADQIYKDINCAWDIGSAINVNSDWTIKKQNSSNKTSAWEISAGQVTIPITSAWRIDAQHTAGINSNWEIQNSRPINITSAWCIDFGDLTGDGDGLILYIVDKAGNRERVKPSNVSAVVTDNAATEITLTIPNKSGMNTNKYIFDEDIEIEADP